jgi:hypothetical protein
MYRQCGIDNTFVYLCYVNQSLHMEAYLSCVHNTKHRTCITRFRISSHDLAIERGRYVHIDRNSRFCKSCNVNVIENEYNFLLVCPAYSDLRNHVSIRTTVTGLICKILLI